MRWVQDSKVSEFPDGVVGFKITGLDPVVERDENSHPVINKFVLNIPFTKSGKPYGSVSEQFKRKHIHKTKHSFPSIRTRMLVEDIEEEILTPIENSTEDLRSRVRLLDTQLQGGDASRVEWKTLSQVLQGAVLAQVNGGLQEIFNAFYAGESVPPEHLDRLTECLLEFLVVTARALRVSKDLVKQREPPQASEASTGTR